MKPKPRTDDEVPLARIRSPQTRGLRTILFTDIVGSLHLKQVHGDRKGVELVLRHHATVRKLLEKFPGSAEIGTAGDSFLLSFSDPAAAVRFALLLQVKLRELEQKTEQPLYDRIGIHLGNVFIQEQEEPGRPTDLYGIELDTCARVMELAEAKQILMTAPVFDYARPLVRAEELDGVSELLWYLHGPYQLKGLDEPVQICEVGEKGFSPLKAPHRPGQSDDSLPVSDSVAGWRPALDQLIPQTDWKLVAKLGEGGFGEVWLGERPVPGNQDLPTGREQRVFKFCFRTERIRSLRREVTLFKILQEHIGNHPHIVSLLGVAFDRPPFYIEMEYVPGRDLHTWCARMGGLEAIPLETRLEIAAQAAEGLQAAHEAGVLHRDVKPGNILVAGEGNQVQVKLTDFGIGQVVSQERLADLTRAGFTQTIVMQLSSSPTGTQLYMAPETLAGKPASSRSDIFSLGMVLYQLVVGDLSRPLTTDWAKDIADPLLRDDLSRCFAGDPAARFTSAGELARNLRTLDQRRAERAHRMEELARRERAAYRQGLIRAASIAAVIVSIMAALVLYARSEARRAERNAVQALLAQAQSGRLSGSAGQRFAGLAALAKAAESGHSLDLRNEAIACLALPDLRVSDSGSWHAALAAGSPLAFHPNLRAFAQSEPDGWIHVRSPDPDRKPVRFQPGGNVHTLRFARSGEELAALSSTPHGALLQIWSLKTNAEIFRRTSSAGFTDIDLHGETLAFGQRDGSVQIVDWIANETLATFQLAQPADSIRFSPDGSRVALAGKGSLKLRVVSLTEDSSFLEFDHSDSLHSIAWHPDGTMVAASCGNKLIFLWHLESGDSHTLQGHQGIPRRLAFSHDGSLLASWGDDKILHLWDPYRANLLLKYSNPNGEIPDLQFSANDRLLGFNLLGSRIQLLEVASEAACRKIQDSASYLRAAQQIEIDSDSKVVLVAHQGGIDFWDWSAGRRIGSLAMGPVRSALIHPQTGELLTSGFYGVHRFPFQFLPEQGGETLEIGQAIPTDSPAETGPMSASSDGSLLAVLVQDGVLLYRGGELAGPVRLPDEPGLRAVAVSPDGSWIAAGNWKTGRLRIWRGEDGRAATNITLNAPAQLAFSPDSRWLAVATIEECRLWRTGTWERQPLLLRKPASNRPAPVAFRPDGALLAWGIGETSIRLVDPFTGSLIADLTSPIVGSLLNLKFSPCGTRILAISDRYPVFDWRLPDLRDELSKLGLDWELPRLEAPEARDLALRLRNKANIEALAQQHDFREVNEHLRANPRDAQAHFRRGQLHARRKEFTKAIEDFSKALELDESGDALLERALAYKELGNTAEAIEDLKRLRALKPHQVRCYRELASLYLLGPADTRDYQAGLEIARQALQIDPEDYSLLLYAGVGYYRVGDYTRCIETMDAALTLKGLRQPSMAALCFKGMAHAKLGNLAEAARLQAEAREILRRHPDPNSSFVQQMIRELESLITLQ